MKRRTFLLGALGVGAVGAAGWRMSPRLVNPCADAALPAPLRDHPLIRAAWDGLQANAVWDSHVHLVGVGDNGSGIWITPKMRSWRHPIQSAQRLFYQNAGCANYSGNVDNSFLARLVALHAGMAPGSKLMLLSFDYNYDANGVRDLDRSSFHTPNDYARDVVRRFPEKFEWIASVHPYRPDAVEALERAVRDGARAVKWLPSAMGIDPAAPVCDRFYEVLVRHDLPLLSHTGSELAVHGGEADEFNNPLRLRRALERGVRVIAAHCASEGEFADIDRGTGALRARAFDLFSRLMAERRYEGKLFGEISAMTQTNRMGTPLETVVLRNDWHSRLINGSDYPLPGVMPLFSMRKYVEQGYLTGADADTLDQLRHHNPILFDFVLKRSIRVHGHRLGSAVFESRRVFSRVAMSPQRK